MNRAFTLTETFITIALSVVIMLALVNLYLNFNTLYLYQQTYVATTNAAGNALKALNAAVLPADLVIASHTFSGTTITTGTSTLVLELPSINASGDIIAGAHDYIGFATTSSSTDLYQRTDANAASTRTSGVRRVATLVDSLFLGYDTSSATAATRISATTTTKLVTKNGTVQTTLHQLFYLRNR
jgi:hypothetical protein